MTSQNLLDELKSIARKADQLCSIHAGVRDKLNLYAAILDYGSMAVATYLAGLVFVEPQIGLRLSFGFDDKIWIGGLSLATFFLSIIQFKSDWKTKSQAHHRSSKEYSDLKSECRTLISSPNMITDVSLDKIKARYNIVSELGTFVPEKEFLKGKSKHLRKVFMSKYLDDHPAAWFFLLKIKLFLRDNLNINFL